MKTPSWWILSVAMAASIVATTACGGESKKASNQGGSAGTTVGGEGGVVSAGAEGEETSEGGENTSLGGASSGSGGSADGGMESNGGDAQGGSGVGGQSGSANGGQSGSANGGAAGADCDNAETINGYVYCNYRAWAHRPNIETCPNLLPRDGITCGLPLGDCSSDADCTALPHGYCSGGGADLCGCKYGCTTDADCAEGSICMCGTNIGTCVKAIDCQSDADCGADSLCASYEGTLCGSIAGFACQSAADQCKSQTDCTGSGCMLTASGARECGPCAVP